MMKKICIFAKQTDASVCKTKKNIKNVKLKNIIFYIFLILPLFASAQGGDNAFNILRLSGSSHVSALGGTNISIYDDDLSLSLSNPALLSNVSDKTISLSFMTYISDSKVTGAAFNKTFGERAAAAVWARYIDYGEFDGYTEDNIYTGTFRAKDMEFSLLYSYLLGDYWSGGVTGKFIYSKYEEMSSIALGVDLGLNYYDPDKEFSASLVFKNLGGQVKSFEEKRERMPFDIQLGFTKRLSHAPVRISATLTNLNRWSKDDFYNADGSSDNTAELLLKHFVIGADILIGKNFYASLGYNYRMSKELSSGNSKWDGLSIGAGLHINKVKFSASYSRLHVSSSSFLFNLSYTL